jgi:cell division protein FtsQ
MFSSFLVSETPAGIFSDKILKRILTAVAVVLGVELLWLFGIRPCMPLSHFDIKGIPNVDKAAVLVAAGIGEHSSYITVNREAAEAALALLPMVKSAQVIKRFPSGIEIILEPRRAAAITFLENGERISPALIDGNGMIFSIGREGYRDDVLPVISGLSLDKAYPGMKLSRVYRGLFGQLEVLAAESPQLLSTISEIRVNQKNYDGFDLTLFPVHIPVKVRTGPDLDAEILRYMLLMLDVLSPRAAEIEEIDFRTGTASYTLKEAHSG